ncbi:MAG: SDR family NAD(P)-dependent oxidoreductase [Polyangiaceae bacterium]
MGSAVVTGAGSGIGRAVAIAFAQRGFDVALWGRTVSPLRETAEMLASVGVRASIARVDVSAAAEVEGAVDSAVRELGVPSVVVNNAGIAGHRAPIEGTDETDWDAVLSVNLKGVFLVTRAWLGVMRAQGRGRFVTVASISATLGSPGLAAYCASKWGAVGFTKSLAEELRGSGLQALSVLPGSVDTCMAKVGGFEPVMSPQDVAAVVLFAALDAPDAMNGAAVECFG